MLGDLITRVLGGDADAYAQIVKAHQGTVTSYAAFRLPDPDLVDEVVQQTFVRAYERLGECDLNADLGAWLRTICHYFILTERKRAIEGCRNRANYTSQIRHVLLAASERRPDEASDDADGVALLRRCRERLPEEARELVSLRYDEEHGLEAIAERVARSVTWVSTTLFRIRAALRRCIEEHAERRTA